MDFLTLPFQVLFRFFYSFIHPDPKPRVSRLIDLSFCQASFPLPSFLVLLVIDILTPVQKIISSAQSCSAMKA